MTEKQAKPLPTIGSTEFRIRYKELPEVTAVTVLGRVIGWWYPAKPPTPPKEAR